MFSLVSVATLNGKYWISNILPTLAVSDIPLLDTPSVPLVCAAINILAKSESRTVPLDTIFIQRTALFGSLATFALKLKLKDVAVPSSSSVYVYLV